MGAEFGGAVGVSEQVFHLGELPDVLVDLAVKYTAVGDNNHGIKQILLPGLVIEFHELIAQPCDGMGLSRPGGVLDEIAQT